MLDSKKVLKIYGVLFIFFAVLDIITVASNWFSSNINDIQLPDGTESIVKVITIVGLVIIALEILIKLYLGVRGIQQSKGIYKGKTNIKLAQIILVLTVILALIELPGLKLEKSSIMGIMDDIVVIFIICDYIKYGKKVLDE